MSETRPIDCERVLRMLFEYLDGELGDEQRQTVDRHLALCRSCFSRAEFETRLRSYLREAGEAAVPPALENRVRAIIKQFS